MAQIRLNGVEHELAAPALRGVALVDVLGAVDCTGVAVAVNGSVVPRSRWGTTTVLDGDAVEVVTAAQGG